MSTTATTWAYQQRIGSPTAKLVLLALADQAGSDGSCFPGYKHLQEMTELSAKSLERHIRNLEVAGLLSRERRHTKHGRRTSDCYTLALGQAFIVRTGQASPDSVSTSQRVASERSPDSKSASDYPPLSPDLPDSLSGVVLGLPVSEPTTTTKPARSSPRFDEFWKLYPKREGKAGTKKKWETVTRTVDADLILAGLRRYLTHIQRRGTDRQYVKNPETWLNKGCWDDEYDSAPTAADGSGWQLPDPPAGMEVGGAEWQSWRLEQQNARRSA